MEQKKISFGFSKILKKPNLLSNNDKKLPEDNNIELIKCLEGQEIKLMVEKKRETQLVIPMKENQKTPAALASLMKRRAILLGEEEEEPPPSNKNKEEDILDNICDEDDLNKRAARELLQELKNEKVESKNLVLPIVKPDELPLDGAKESTLDDYDSIPIEQFGMAMLRGMGFVEPPKTKQMNGVANDVPFIRPKGMGLGADKAIKPKPLLVQPEANETLTIKKQAYVRILGGKYNNNYGQIEGFDDHAGRVIVRMAIGGGKEAFNEFLCQPVTKKEFEQYGKCINAAKFEEYKKLENEQGQIIIKKEKRDEKPYTQRENHKYKDEYNKNKLQISKGHEREREINNKHKYDKEDVTEEYYEDRNNCRKRSYNERSDEYKHRYDDRFDNRRSHHTNRNSRDNSTNSRNEYNASQRRNNKYNERYKDEKETRIKNISPSSNERKSDHYPSSSSNRNSHHRSTQHSTDESSDSNDSDTDSAYDRTKDMKKKKKKRKSSKKTKLTKKCKDNNKSKHKKYSESSSSSNPNDSESSCDSETDKKHKKKTKKSKRERSRSRSRSRRY